MLMKLGQLYLWLVNYDLTQVADTGIKHQYGIPPQHTEGSAHE
jgi:hypothetical protein